MKNRNLLKTVVFVIAAILIGGLFGSFELALLGGTGLAFVAPVGGVDYDGAIKALREQVGAKQNEMRALITSAEKENRDFNETEKTTYDKLDGEVRSLQERIKRLEDAEKLNANNATQQRATDDKSEIEQRKKDTDAAFRAWLRGGDNALSPAQRALIEEHRSMATTPDANGGYTVPEGFSGYLEVALKAYGGILDVAEILETETGNDIPFPVANDTGNTGAILGENTTMGDSVDPTLNAVIMKAFTYSSKPVIISNQLLQDNGVNLEKHIAEMLVRRVMSAFNAHAITGGGSAAPQGVVVGGTKGVDAAVNAITYDNLVDLYHSVDPEYRKNAVWMLNDSTLKALKKLKDTEGAYIFQPSLRDGEPSTILGKRFIVNNSMPEIGASNKSVVFGDFKKYLVRRVKGFSVKRLVERYADLNATAFILFARMDGRVLDAGTNPLKYLQHAAS